jgi:hypothetical protein
MKDLAATRKRHAHLLAQKQLEEGNTDEAPLREKAKGNGMSASDPSMMKAGGRSVKMTLFAADGQRHCRDRQGAGGSGDGGYLLFGRHICSAVRWIDRSSDLRHRDGLLSFGSVAVLFAL